MTISEIGIDLSKLSLSDLEKIASTSGIPGRILDNVEMLSILRSDDARQPVEGPDISKEWTVETSPRTKKKIGKIIGRSL